MSVVMLTTWLVLGQVKSCKKDAHWVSAALSERPVHVY